MCGRLTIRKPAGEVIARFGLRELAAFAARFNVAPTQNVLAIRQEDGERRGDWLRWGLIPSWAKDDSMGAKMINARGETVAEKPSFRAAFKSRRCLVAADGFYEWQAAGKTKQPFHIRREDGELFALAGLWEKWVAPSGQAVESCTVVTTSANEFMRPLHERMPVILSDAEYDLWLSPESPADDLSPLFSSRETPGLEMVPVSTRVNSPRNDDEACLWPEGMGENRLF